MIQDLQVKAHRSHLGMLVSRVKVYSTSHTKKQNISKLEGGAKVSPWETL